MQLLVVITQVSFVRQTFGNTRSFIKETTEQCQLLKRKQLKEILFPSISFGCDPFNNISAGLFLNYTTQQTSSRENLFYRSSIRIQFFQRQNIYKKIKQ